MVLSSTFRMAATPTAEADEARPRQPAAAPMRVRRLEGEAIRDEILPVSGRLDPQMFGPGVEVFLTPEMRAYTADYGKPDAERPAGRRRAAQRLPDGPAQLPLADDARLRHARRREHRRPAQRFQCPGPGADPDERPVRRRAGAAWATRVPAVKDEPDSRRRRGTCPPDVPRRLRPPAHRRRNCRTCWTFLDEHGARLGVPPERRSGDPHSGRTSPTSLMNVKEFIFLN